jgi:hypothetical protein
MSVNVLPIAPNFRWSDTVSAQVKEIVTTVTTEQLDALLKPPKKSIQWANLGSKLTIGSGIVKAAVRLPSSAFFVDFDEKRDGGSLDVFAPIVYVSPKMLNFYWPMIWGSSGFQGIGATGSGMNGRPVEEFMGAGGLATAIVEAARAHKAYLAATLVMTGYTSSSQSITATRVTYPQPGFPNGLPLWSNSANTGSHYSHPFNPNSDRFDNLFEAYGAFGAYNLQRTMLNMYNVPHPCMPGLTLENQVTDIVGPTWMQDIFYQTAVQTVNLQTATVGGNGVAAATTNAYNAELLKSLNSATFIGASGIGPVRYWVSSLLNKHPYYWNNATNSATAHMTDGANGGPSHMWLAISAEPGDTQTWCEFAGPSDFLPQIHLFGDGDPKSIEIRKVRMLSDLDAGVGAGLPHPTALYFEK